ncbi:DUF6979 family protein [Deinococcus cellulosilyticus]|uniref:Uncharacterized protein n=1 Tax=Deinococcus cellulosilyticus (strain DSM 18568 / NBRC 106333 / KACC 11606 / 5516J-15) TaxID=1223518 RepID=A0A511MZ57_DEIC1|nr:hypothetical protein [Deinococcus cellulosilyticus]GEM45416.1 hypothetical protein DC3_10510 [Deinococcus cellulosilyticus NBRC 106333 = KACC 11606]
MSQYGDIAILAVELFPDLQDARDAWQMATEALGQADSLPVQKAQSTFLVLCDAGKVLGIPASPTATQEGGQVLKALDALQRASAPSRASLSLSLQQDPGVQHEEIDVLLSLWEVGLLDGELSEV